MSYLIDRAEEAQKRKLDFAREQSDRAAVASGNVDKNSALYRHAKLNGWDLGGKDELHGPARANAVARDAAATDLMEQRAAGAPRSPISTFAADGDGNFSFYNEDNALRSGFDGIMANANAQKADRARRGRATLGSMVGHAMDNGGMVPRELGAAYGQELGQNGPMFGTLAKDGTFMSLGVGQYGSVQPTGLVRPFDVMKSMVQSGDWKNAQKYAKKYLDGKYTPEQIAGATGFSPQWARSAATNELSAADKRFQLEALKVLQEMDKANKMPVTAEDFYRNNPKLITMLGTDYQRDENGQVVMDEMTGKPIEIALPPEEISKRAVAFFDGLRQSQASGGGDGLNEIQRAIVDGIRALTTPPTADPRDAAMSDEVRQQMYIRSGRPLTGIMLGNGRQIAGNFYERNGNIYDGTGRLVGTTEEVRDYDGNPIKASVSTSAPAQQQSQQPTREEIQAELARRRAAKAQQQQQSVPLSQPVTSLESPTPARGQYGLRNDGKTYKGTGWLGELKLPNGGVATEYTMQSDAVRDANGNRIDFPSLVPTLTKDEVDLMVNDIIPNHKPVPDAIAQKAVDFARDRMSKGQSVFAKGQQNPRNDGATPLLSKELREKNTSRGAKAERESATSEELWGGDVVERFRRNHPEATDEDIRSGKFDRVLEKIGSALHGDGYKSRNLSLRDKESRLRAYEEQAARNRAAEQNRQAHIAAMREREQAIAQKAQDLFGDAWRQADDWAIEHHGDGVFFKDSYKTARAKKFAELVKEKAKKDNIQLYNIYKLGNNVFGTYDVGNVFDTTFGDGAGTYFGRAKSGAENRLSPTLKKKEKED